MSRGSTFFDRRRFCSLVEERGLGLGQPFHAFSETESTNDCALAAAKAGAPHGATFFADAQTSGRGRRGQRWYTAPGENLTFSVLLRPALAPDRASAFTLAVGLAVREVLATVSGINLPICIKWPNDVLAQGKKLAGILTESQLQGSELSALIVGIGLNVHMRELPLEIANLATSLALLGAREVDRETLLADVLEALASRLRRYENTGLYGFADELYAHDFLRGKRLRVDEVTGYARGIHESGALIVENDLGQLIQLMSGSVELA